MFINNHLVKYAKNTWLSLIFLTILNLLIILSASAVMLFTSLLINSALISRYPVIELCNIVCLILICLILNFVLFKTRTIFSERAANHIKDNVRFLLLQKIFELGPAYTGKKRTGDLATVLTSSVEALKYYYSNYFPIAIASIINMLIFVFLLMRIDFISSAFSFISCVFMLIVPMFFFFKMKDKGNEEWKERSTYYSDCLEGIQGISTLKSLNANKTHINKIKEQGEKLRKAVMRHLLVTMTEGAVLEFFARGGMILSILIITLRYVSGSILSSQTIFAYFFVSACFTPMLGLINAWHLGFQGVSSSYLISDLLREGKKDNEVSSLNMNALRKKIEIDNLKITDNTECLDGDIEVSDICFSYNSEDGNIIQNVSFSIKKGSMTALVGASGSGKSTIAQLISGFYPINSGKICVGNLNTDDRKSKLIKNISAVWQDSYVFYGSVYENILIANPFATKEDVHRVAKLANIHEFIMSLPEGYDTILGERGLKFSGGERQRVAIARSYLRDRPFLIFDEATSSLDMKNELQIQKSFENLRKNRTTLVIAHRMSTIKNADQICVLKNGKIVAKGKHSSLLKYSDDYKKLMTDQL